MISGPLGGGPDEPGGEPDEPWSGGWVPPDVRPWRHPSELFSAATPSAPLRTGGGRAAATAAVAVTAAAAITVGLLLLVSAAGGGPAPSTVSLTLTTAAVTPCCRLTAPVAASAIEAVVELRGRTGRRFGYGVVVGGGGLVATTERALDGATTLRAVSASGAAMTVEVVATDPGSGIALLRLSGALDPSPAGRHTAHDRVAGADLWTGSPAMTVSMVDRGSRAETKWASGTVVSLDAAMQSGPGAGMAAIMVRGASVPAVPGEPLIDPAGDIVGIFDASEGSELAFLPMTLVDGVSQDLEMTGWVRHGWLDVTDTTGDGGALVVSVESGGASTAELDPGDVIVGLDGTPVWSPAELRSMLYVRSPGTQVSLDVVHHGTLRTVDVDLSSSP